VQGRLELKIFLQLLELHVGWQLLMVDGNGILHPRGDLLLFLSIWKVVIPVVDYILGII
jgi:hypothetical protein